MYYVLDCLEPLSPNGEALLEVHNTFRVGAIRLWKSGARHRTPVPQPIEMVFDTFRGYDGPPVEMLDLGIPIMSARLAGALTDAGVDNIDFYDVALRHRETGIQHAYKAYNIIGLVSAADLGNSEWLGGSNEQRIDMPLTTLAIDKNACADHRLFRLAENVNAIVVRQDVREILEKSGFPSLRFKRPEDWMHI